jgi:hypothetical protein
MIEVLDSPLVTGRRNSGGLLRDRKPATVRQDRQYLPPYRVYQFFRRRIYFPSGIGIDCATFEVLDLTVTNIFSFCDRESQRAFTAPSSS